MLYKEILGFELEPTVLNFLFLLFVGERRFLKVICFFKSLHCMEKTRCIVCFPHHEFVFLLGVCWRRWACVLLLARFVGFSDALFEG